MPSNLVSVHVVLKCLHEGLSADTGYGHASKYNTS